MLTWSRWSERVLSARVIARLIDRRWPRSTPSARPEMSGVKQGTPPAQVCGRVDGGWRWGQDPQSAVRDTHRARNS